MTLPVQSDAKNARPISSVGLRTQADGYLEMYLHIAWIAIGVVGPIVLFFVVRDVYVFFKSGSQQEDEDASTPLKATDSVNPSEPLYPIDCKRANRYHYMGVWAALLSLVATALFTIEAWKKRMSQSYSSVCSPGPLARRFGSGMNTSFFPTICKVRKGA